MLGTVRHKKAEKSLDSLKSLSSPSAKVIRGGQKMEVLSKDVVPGDIIIWEAGDMVVADGWYLVSTLYIDSGTSSTICTSTFIIYESFNRLSSSNCDWDADLASTMAFATLTLARLFHRFIPTLCIQIYRVVKK